MHFSSLAATNSAASKANKPTGLLKSLLILALTFVIRFILIVYVFKPFLLLSRVFGYSLPLAKGFVEYPVTNLVRVYSGIKQTGTNAAILSTKGIFVGTKNYHL